MNTQPARRLVPLRPLLIVIGLFGIGWLVCVLALWIRGGAVFVYDAKVVDFGVCLTDTQYDPVGMVPLSSQRFYLCGQTAGTTFLPGALTIDNAGKVVFSAAGNYGPGYFYQEVVMSDSFVPRQLRGTVWVWPAGRGIGEVHGGCYGASQSSRSNIRLPAADSPSS